MMLVAVSRERLQLLARKIDAFKTMLMPPGFGASEKFAIRTPVSVKRSSTTIALTLLDHLAFRAVQTAYGNIPL